MSQFRRSCAHNVRRYVQQHKVDASLPGLPPTTIDGITELWFDNLDGVGGCEFILSDEHPVYP